MALTATFRVAHNTTGTPHGTGTTTTGTFSIGAGDRVVMFVCIMDDGSVAGDQTPGTPTITNNAGLTFTEIGGQANTASYRQRVSAHISDASGSSQTLRTITLDEPANISVYSYTALVWTVAGDFDTGDLTDGFVGVADTADGAETLVVTETPVAADLVFYGQGTDASAAANPTYSGATWDTNRSAGTAGVGNWLAGNFRTANTSANVVITDVYTGGGSFFKNTAVAFILRNLDTGVTGTSAQTLAAFTSTATGSVNNPPGVLYVKEVGFVTNAVSSSSEPITVAAGGVPIGDYLVLYGACDNTGASGVATTIAVADNSNNAGTANVYTLQTPQAIADPGAAAAGCQGFFVVCPVTRSLDAGDTITVTFGNATVAKAINCQQFTPSIPGPITVLASSYARQDNQTGQAVSVATGVDPGLAAQVVCALVAVEGGTADAFTQDVDTTNGVWVTLTRRGAGTTVAGSTLNSAYKIVTAGGAQTYNHATMLGTARDHCAAVLILDSPDITGTVAVTLAPFTSTASGTISAGGVTGTSAQTLAAFTSTASGTETISGSSAQTLAAFTSTATGTERFTGTVAVTLAAFTSTASGAETISGTSARTLAAFTSTAAGTETISGSSAQTLANATSTTVGTVANPVTGTSAQTLAAFTSTATGVEVFTGTSTQTLAPFTSTAAGTVANPVTGSSAQTLAAFTSTASGTETITGSSGQTLAAFTSTTVAWHTVTGSSAQTLAAFTATATGAVVGASTANPTLADFTSTATGAVVFTGSSAQTLTDFTVSASGVVANPITGTSAQSLAPFTSTAAGTETITGSSGQTLANATSTTAGTVANPVTGTSAQTLANVTSTATGSMVGASTANPTLADFTSTASGAVVFTGAGASVLADATSTATGTETISGSSAQTLAPFTVAATAELLLQASAAATLAAFTSTATGNTGTTINGTAAVTLQDFVAGRFILGDGPRISTTSPDRISSEHPGRVSSRAPGRISSYDPDRIRSRSSATIESMA